MCRFVVLKGMVKLQKIC